MSWSGKPLLPLGGSEKTVAITSHWFLLFSFLCGCALHKCVQGEIQTWVTKVQRVLCDNGVVVSTVRQDWGTPSVCCTGRAGSGLELGYLLGVEAARLGACRWCSVCSRQ